MRFKKFSKEHIEEARKLALNNYEEERLAVPELPAVDSIPMVELFAENGLGIVAFENDKMVGFLGCFEPWSDAFDFLGDKGTFCPLMGHGAVKENRILIYQKMFEKAASEWGNKEISSFAIALYAHDSEASRLSLNTDLDNDVQIKFVVWKVLEKSKIKILCLKNLNFLVFLKFVI